MKARRALPVCGSRVAVHAELPPRPEELDAGSWPSLVDGRGRRYTYLRLSVTDRCDLACMYCMPPGGELEHASRPELLSFEELGRLVGVFGRMGVRRVRLTGGEPLVRKDVVQLVATLRASAELDELVMTSNGTRLAELARPLADAGLDGVNVSIDSLDRDRFRTITRGGDLDAVLAGVRAALEAGLAVKLNTVVLGGANDDELGAIVDWAWARGITPRFIELMPIGEGARLEAASFVGAATIVERLGDRVRADVLGVADVGRGPARYLSAAAGAQRVGLITAVSDEFCGACNRVRVSAKGDLRACLADRGAVSLRGAMRRGCDDLELAWAALWALGAKGAGHGFVDPAVREHERVGMSLIGG